jgi:phage terminase large subunit
MVIAPAVDQRIRVPILRPRAWQREVLVAREQGIRRLVVVVHRRAGKTVLGLTLLILGMLQRPGVYFYLAPFYNMGRKILWDGRDHLGRPFLDHFPPALVRAKNETEMQIELATAHGASSIFQVLGADQPDRLRGVNPFGVVLDEFSIMETAHPWDLLRPILAENGGWAAFLYTPAGRNHGHELYEQARQRADWFTTLKTTEDTRRDGPGEDGGSIISRAQIEEEIAAGMPRELANQEFGCSFVSATPGAYFSKELDDAERGGRIRNVPWDPTLGVTTAWDLGISDAMAICFAQTTGIEVRIIDYLEDTGQGSPTMPSGSGRSPIATRNTSCPTTPSSGRSEPVRRAWKRSAP